MVHGVGGAVGTALLQLGRLFDLKMYGTASKSKHDFIARLGATPIDYKNEDFVERIDRLMDDGVDVAFDPIGGANFKRSFQTLSPGERLVAYGFYNASIGRESGNIMLTFLRMLLWNIMPNRQSTAFYSIGSWRKKHPDWFAEDLTTLFKLLVQSNIQPIIARRMPLQEAGHTHKLIEQAAVNGKIVLMVGA